jgi:thiamine biosynthesis lipoprotein
MTITGFAQGGTYTVKLNLNGTDGMIKVQPEEIRDSIDAILQAIDNSVSGYNKKSLLSRFNAGETIIPDEIFMDIYGHAYEIYELTEGVVDVAAAPLFDIWGFGFANDSLPSSDKVAQVLAESGMQRLARDMYPAAEHGLNASEILENEGVLPKLNYNAIAQGYSCDLVAEYLYSIGVKDMMVDIGEIFCDGKNPAGQSWSLGIDRPVDGNNELGAQIQGVFRAPEGPHGIVTSGNYRKFYVRDGKKYAHTIDPRNGYPVQHTLLSATIVAPDAMTADAYATYCMVVGLEVSKKFLTENPDLEGCLIYDEDGAFKTWCSAGFVLEEL